MTDDGHAGDLVGAYVLQACSPEEMRVIAEHERHCAACAADIADARRVTEWVGMSAARDPGPGLRSRVLSAALAARPAAPSEEVRRLGELYQEQVDDLDRLLARLPRERWRQPSGPHESVRALVRHLHGNDEWVASAAGVLSRVYTADERRAWRRQADAIVEASTRPGAELIDREVRLAGRGAVMRPMRDALIQRGFETWIHAGDVRDVLGMPRRRPSGRQLTDIVDFALGLIPAAMAAAGRGHPAKAIELALTGDGGGRRLVGLSPANPAGGDVVAEISLPADRFCLLLAGRLAGPHLEAEVDGDRVIAGDFLAVAATMGCD